MKKCTPVHIRPKAVDGARIQASIRGSEGETRTAVAVAATSGLIKTYDEKVCRLLVNDDAVDLREFIGGPVLMDHHQTIESLLGCVERAWVDNGRLFAQVRWARHAHRYADMVDDEITVHCSVGLHIDCVQRISEHQFVATRWRPWELSLVPRGADPSARFTTSEDAKKALSRCADNDAAQKRVAILRRLEGVHCDSWNSWAGKAASRIAAQIDADPAAIESALRGQVAEHLHALTLEAQG